MLVLSLAKEQEGMRERIHAFVDERLLLFAHDNEVKRADTCSSSPI